jgi:hypothetical protein
MAVRPEDPSVLTSRGRSTGFHAYRFNLLSQALKKLFVSFVNESQKLKPICERSG